MQPHCPSRKRRERSLRSAQTCEEKSCICSDWGMAEMTPKSPAVRQASITTVTLLMGVLCWTNVSMGLEHRSIGGGKLRCVISLCSCEKTAKACKRHLCTRGKRVRTRKPAVRSCNQPCRTDSPRRESHGRETRLDSKCTQPHEWGPLLFVKGAEPKKGQGIRVRLRGLDSHYCHDDEQQIPAQGRTRR
jgi:hypothetical protein